MPAAEIISPSAPVRVLPSGRIVPAEDRPAPLPASPVTRGGYLVRPCADGTALLIDPRGDVVSPFVSVELANRTVAFLTR